jgi:hypothetical protein
MKYDGFDKKDWLVYCLCVVIIVVICAFSGCRTTKAATGTAGYTNAYILGQLTESVNEFDRGIGTAIEKSRNITDEVDRIDKLFTEYERSALRLRDEIDNLRKQIEDQNKGDSSGINNIGSDRIDKNSEADITDKGN